MEKLNEIVNELAKLRQDVSHFAYDIKYSDAASNRAIEMGYDYIITTPAARDPRCKWETAIKRIAELRMSLVATRKESSCGEISQDDEIFDKAAMYSLLLNLRPKAEAVSRRLSASNKSKFENMMEEIKTFERLLGNFENETALLEKNEVNYFIHVPSKRIFDFSAIETKSIGFDAGLYGQLLACYYDKIAGREK